MALNYNYPQEIKGSRKLYSLFNGVKDPLGVISGNHAIAGDSYHLKANLTNKHFIFSYKRCLVKT